MPQTQDIPHILHDSAVVSSIMSRISSGERAYHLRDGLKLGISCRMLFCKGFSELIQAFPNLEVLVMTGVDNINWNIIYSLKKLRVLHISFQGQAIDFLGIISCFPLRVISIQNTPLESIPSPILRIKNLESLSFINCGIKKLPTQYTNGQNLVELFLANNRITRIPNAILDLSGLIHINFSNNKIKELSVKDGWKNVKYLNLNQNKINQITSAPRNVNTLLLSNNKIKEFNDFVNLDSLVKLDLSKNKIVKINKIQKASGIRFLDLSHNELIEISSLENAATASRLKSLKELDISHNKIEKIPGRIINNCTNLERISLGKNNWQESQWEALLMLKDGLLDRSLSFALQGEIKYTLFKKYIISCNKYALSFEERKKYLHSYLNVDTLNDLELLEVVPCPFLTFRRIFKNRLFGNKEDTSRQENGINFPKEMLGNIRKLLLSRNKNNIELGLEILKPYCVHEDLVLLLFVISIFDDVSKYLKNKIRNGLPYFLKNINKSNFPKNETGLYELLISLKKEGWDTEDMIQYIFKHNQKGWLYIYKENDKNILLELISNNGTLDLSGAGLSKIPKEIIGCERIRILDLQKNNFCRIPEEILSFPNLKIIYLQKNKIKNADALFQGAFNQVFLQGNKMSRNYLDELNSRIITTLIY